MVQNTGQLVFAEGVIISAGSVVCCQGYNHAENTSIIIGENTYIGENNNIRSSDSKITIGKNCLISQMVSIIGANHNIPAQGKEILYSGLNEKKMGVRIGDDVWVGCNVVILPGVTIGNGAVIGAGSIVTNDIPPNAISVGAPAKVLKYREKE